MELKYLQKIKENPRINGFANRPFNKEQIKELELKYNDGKAFPMAFEEFLIQAGEFNNFGFDFIDGFNELQVYLQKDLLSVNYKIERPFIAFDVWDSQYSVIFLDEEKEDPDVYIVDPFGAAEENLPLVKPNGWKFSDLVNESIRRRKLGLPD